MSVQRIIAGDCIAGMRTLPDASVHCCVTSPPYWNQRDYQHDGQIGLEATPEAYVSRMVEVFREVRRVLRDDGTLWLNLGDSYASTPPGNTTKGVSGASTLHGVNGKSGRYRETLANGHQTRRSTIVDGLKPKDLVGIPWRVAFALQADGWWLRQDIIWAKPNPMPESVRDRCTKAHEYVFLMAKSGRYYYDAEAVSEVAAGVSGGASFGKQRHDAAGTMAQSRKYERPNYATRNRRSVWTVTTKPYSGAHFAVMPPDLVAPCIKAGCPKGGTVLDPFAGSGTTLAVAATLDRNAIGCELNPDYIALAERRISKARSGVSLFEEGGQ